MINDNDVIELIVRFDNELYLYSLWNVVKLFSCKESKLFFFTRTRALIAYKKKTI